MTISTSLVDELRAVLSPGSLVAEASELPAYGLDVRGSQGIPGVVVRAQWVEDVAATMRLASRHGISVVPRAAGTNVSGGYVPTAERIMLDLRPLDRILRIDADRREAVVEAGTLNGAVNARVAPLGLRYIPDPGSAASSTLGGNIAENAGGMHCLKYGVTVHHVVAVQCVLPAGDVIRLTARDVGPDLLGVIVGSEGTLGVVTEATLSLQPLPRVTRTLLAAFDRSEEAAEAVSAIIARGVIPAALEFIDRLAATLIESYAHVGYPTDAEALLLMNLEGEVADVSADVAAAEAILRRHARSVRRADDDETGAALWRGRYLFGNAMLATGQGLCLCDTTVPRERIPAMQRDVQEIARRFRLTITMIGHAGDGNIHPIIMFDRADPAQTVAAQAADDAITLAALALGGTITGEHGVGSLKRRQMNKRFTPPEISAMRAVKKAFDPDGILNPGILLPDLSPDEPPLPIFQCAIEMAVDAHRGDQVRQLWGSATSPAPDAALGANQRATLDVENLTVTVDSGMSRMALRSALGERGYHCVLAPEGGSDSLQSVGEAIALGSDRAAIRDCLLAVKATLPHGYPVRFGSNAVKDVAGYDLKRLYIGSGVAFGTLQEVTLRVVPVRSPSQ